MSTAVLVAIGMVATGEPRILGVEGVELAASNDGGNAWAPFHSALVERGMAGSGL